jgi:hypothetical protein
MGRPHQTDKSGIIINDCSLASIIAPWDLLVDRIVAAYKEVFHERLHSIYLRGSVARGTAVAGQSDIDAFAIVTDCVSFADHQALLTFETSIWAGCRVATAVEMGYAHLDGILNDGSHDHLRFLLKIQGVCLFGESILSRLPCCRLDHRAIIERLHLEECIRAALESLKVCEPSSINKICRWIMKKIVRSGFELVMHNEQYFTRDLFPCYQGFARHYPRMECAMKQAAEYSLFPPVDRRVISQVLGNFGAWLIDTIHTINTHS